MDTIKIDDSTRRVVLSLKELEDIMGKAGIIKANETISFAMTSQGKLRIIIIKE